MTPPAATEHLPFHVSADRLAAGLGEVSGSPRDEGAVALLVRRPAPGERDTPAAVEFSTEAGVVGDGWAVRGSTSSPDGGPHPDAQVTVMNVRLARLVAGTDERAALAGDQVLVDLDLSVDNLPAGTRLALGTAVLEVTAKPHRGCALFAERFGVEALRFVNAPEHRELRLRGLNARVVTPGTARVGDVVRVLR